MLCITSLLLSVQFTDSTRSLYYMELWTDKMDLRCVLCFNKSYIKERGHAVALHHSSPLSHRISLAIPVNLCAKNKASKNGGLFSSFYVNLQRMVSRHTLDHRKKQKNTEKQYLFSTKTCDVRMYSYFSSSFLSLSWLHIFFLFL
jgi:hypothetical protein